MINISSNAQLLMECAKTRHRVLDLIYHHGQPDNSHHEAWLLNEIVKELTGDSYDNWVYKYENETGCEWEEGISP